MTRHLARGAGHGRPRLCTVCHAAASWAIETTLPATVLRLIGPPLLTRRVERVFFCAEHIDKVAA